MWVCRWRSSSASTSTPWGSTSRRIASPSSRRAATARSSARPAELKAARKLKYSTSLKDLGKLPRIHRHGPDADRSIQPARPHAARAFERDRRQGAQEGRRGGVRVHRVSGLHRRGLHSDPRARVGTQVQQGFLRGLQPRAHQSGRQGTSPAEHQEGDLGFDARSRRLRRRAVSHRGARRHAQGVEHPRRRGRQGHREHAARREHRAHQRAGAALQPPRHRHRRSAAGRGQQVELPAVPSGPGRRPLHRRRSLLPDAQGAGDRLPSRDDPRRPPAQRQHG